MEECSRSINAQSGLAQDNYDWRATFTPDFRYKVINKILGSLKLHSNPEGLIQLTKAVEQFEETAFQKAKSKDDYCRTITKRLEMVNQSYPRIVGVSSSIPGLTQKKSMVPGGEKSSGFKNACQASSEFPDDSVGQGMQLNLSANNKREIPGTLPSQKMLYQQNQQKESKYQFLEHNGQQNASLVKDIDENHHHQQQQHILSESNLFQCSQNQALPTDSRQPPLIEQSSTLVFQQNQLVAKENNVEQQLSSSWKSMPNSFQQAVPLQTSLASATPTEEAKMAESHDQAYQKLQSMKKQYLPYLTLVYNKLNENCQKSQVPEIVQKYKRIINAAERWIKVLSMPRENSVSVQLYAQRQSPGCQSQMSQQQQHTNWEHQFHPMNLVLTSTPVGPPPLSSTQQGVLSSQPNMINSPQGHDLAGTELTKFSHNTFQKSFDSATNSLQKNSIINTFQQERQCEHQMMPPQNIKQHLQPQVIQQKMQLMHMANTQPVATSGDKQNEVPAGSLTVALPGISASLLCTESAGLNSNQQSSATEEPLERLLEAVQSLSPKALSASVSEIGSAMRVVDTIAGTSCYVSGASETRCCLHGRNSSLQYGDSFNKLVKRNTNLKRSIDHISDSESNEKSRFKRHRIEPSNTLLNEIKYINQQLLETVIYLDSTEDTAASGPSEGTMVRCIYGAVGLDENFKMQYASQMLQVLPLRLLVPASYPNSSPVILGGLTFDSSSKNKELINLSEKARLRFSLSLRKLSESVSLVEMAMTWDICTRSVLSECAQLVGGGCFSSRYGKWENCVTAS